MAMPCLARWAHAAGRQCKTLLWVIWREPFSGGAAHAPPGHARARLGAPAARAVRRVAPAQPPQRRSIRKRRCRRRLAGVQLQLQPLHQHRHAHCGSLAAPMLAACAARPMNEIKSKCAPCWSPAVLPTMDTQGRRAGDSEYLSKHRHRPGHSASPPMTTVSRSSQSSQGSSASSAAISSAAPGCAVAAASSGAAAVSSPEPSQAPTGSMLRCCRPRAASAVVQYRLRPSTRRSLTSWASCSIP